MNHLLQLPISPESKLIPWLTHPGSLTAKLQSISENTALQVLNQTWSPPCWWSKNTLKLQQSVLQRNILMLSKNLTCWFARTIIPVASYQENRVFFDRLEKESLGDLVFNSPNVERINLSHYAINKNCIEYYWLPEYLQRGNSPLWLRFSLFVINKNHPFYLMEILLPDLLRISHDME